MHSDAETTVLPVAAPPTGRAAHRRAGGSTSSTGRRRRRRRRVNPVLVVAMAGTAVVGAATGWYAASVSGGDDAGATQPVALRAEYGPMGALDQPAPATGSPSSSLSAAPASASASPSASASSSATAEPTPSATPPGASGSPSAASESPAAGTPGTRDATSTPSAGSAPTSTRPSGTPTAPRSSAAVPSQPGGMATGTAAQYAQQVADLVNEQRSQNGCPAVTVDAKLQTAAQGHSDDMAARHYFEHASPEGAHADSRITAAGYRWSSWGENIAMGQKDPAAVMDAWMHSPGHRANILNCSFTQLGVGVKLGTGGSWWTQNFASPS